MGCFVAPRRPVGSEVDWDVVVHDEFENLARTRGRGEITPAAIDVQAQTRNDPARATGRDSSRD